MRRSARAGLGWVFAVVVLLVPMRLTAAQATQELEDVVYLKDGGIVRGVIMELRPGESVLIRTRDGNQFRYQMAQIDRIVKEPPVGRPQPVPQPTPTEQTQAVRLGGGKSAGTAIALSLLLTGGGQFYNEQPAKGIVLLLLGIGGAAMAIDGVDEYDCDPFESCAPWLLPVGLGLVVGTKVWSLIDAGSGANAWNRRHGYAGRFVPQPYLAVMPLPSADRRPRLGVSLLRVGI